jgi:hypothetical protein
MWPIKLAFLIFVLCPTFLDSVWCFFTLHTIGPIDCFHPSPSLT